MKGSGRGGSASVARASPRTLLFNPLSSMSAEHPGTLKPEYREGAGRSPHMLPPLAPYQCRMTCKPHDTDRLYGDNQCLTPCSHCGVAPVHAPPVPGAHPQGVAHFRSPAHGSRWDASRSLLTGVCAPSGSCAIASPRLPSRQAFGMRGVLLAGPTPRSFDGRRPPP
jgi:hypothetical protein